MSIWRKVNIGNISGFKTHIGSIKFHMYNLHKLKIKLPCYITILFLKIQTQKIKY